MEKTGGLNFWFPRCRLCTSSCYACPHAMHILMLCMSSCYARSHALCLQPDFCPVQASGFPVSWNDFRLIRLSVIVKRSLTAKKAGTRSHLPEYHDHNSINPPHRELPCTLSVNNQAHKTHHENHCTSCTYTSYCSPRSCCSNTSLYRIPFFSSWTFPLSVSFTFHTGLVCFVCLIYYTKYSYLSSIF